MSTDGACAPIKELCGRALDRCSRCFPCLADPARRSSLALKVSLVALHLVYAGFLFLFDEDLIEKTRSEPWYIALYLLLFVAALIQYFVTAGSSPGYVLDAMKTFHEANSLFKTNATASKHPASSNNGSLIGTVDNSQSGRNSVRSSSWAKMVMEFYPPGTSMRTLTCSYCNIEQPPRAKHCHDCDKCVLQFDHHCVWLGTCVGQGNHCRFWWYIFEETALCLWTGILYITYLKTSISGAWWKDLIMIVLLISLVILFIFLLLLLLFHSYLVLTNQTTYELVRRRRIQYLRLDDATAVRRSRVRLGQRDRHSSSLYIRPHARVYEFLRGIGIVPDKLDRLELPVTIEVMKEQIDFLHKLGLTIENVNNYPLVLSCSMKKNMILEFNCLEEFLKDCSLLVKVYAETCTDSVVLKAAVTIWKGCPQLSNLKRS